MTAPTLQVRIDFDDDGLFETGIEDITNYIFGTIEITRGRDQVRALAPPMAPQLTLTLDNGDGRFWPDNTSSPLYPNVRDQHRIRVQATHNSITYTLFTGLISQWLPALDTEQVAVTAIGGFEALAGEVVSTQLYSGIRTGTAIGHILDAIGWPSGASFRDIDDGSTIMPWWWETNGGAFEALMRLVTCEGPPARIDITADGKFLFEGRHNRLVNSGTSLVTFRDTGAEPLLTRPFDVKMGWESVINDVTIPVESLEIDELQTVGEWRGAKTVTGGGAAVFVDVNLDAPCPIITTEVLTEANGRLVSNGLGLVTGLATQTKAQTVTVQLESPDFDAIVRKLIIWGRPLVVSSTRDVTYSDATSITAYGSRGIPGGLDAPFLDDAHAEAIAQTYVEHYKTPLAQVHATVDGAHDTRLPQQLGRDVSDRVTVVASEPSVNRAYYIEQISTSFELPHPWTTTVLGLEEPPVPLVAGGNVFILDSSTQGRLNEDRLGL